MDHSLNNFIFDAVQKLQHLRDKHTLGTYQHEIADRAIDMALGPDRAIDKFLIRNAHRDAKRNMSREAKKRKYISIEAAHDDSYQESLPDNFYEKAYDGSSPEILTFISEIIGHKIFTEPRMHDVLSGMIKNESAAESAIAIGVSPSRISRLRKKVEAAILSLLKE